MCWLLLPPHKRGDTPQTGLLKKDGTSKLKGFLTQREERNLCLSKSNIPPLGYSLSSNDINQNSIKTLQQLTGNGVLNRELNGVDLKIKKSGSILSRKRKAPRPKGIKQ